MIPFVVLSSKQGDKCFNNHSRIHSLPLHWRLVRKAPLIPSIVHWFLLSPGTRVVCPQLLFRLWARESLKSKANAWICWKGNRKSWTHIKVDNDRCVSRSVDFLQWLRDDTVCGYWVVVSQPAKFKYPWPGSKESKRMGNDQIIFSF